MVDKWQALVNVWWMNDEQCPVIVWNEVPLWFTMWYGKLFCDI